MKVFAVCPHRPRRAVQERELVLVLRLQVLYWLTYKVFQSWEVPRPRGPLQIPLAREPLADTSGN